MTKPLSAFLAIALLTSPATASQTPSIVTATPVPQAVLCRTEPMVRSPIMQSVSPVVRAPLQPGTPPPPPPSPPPPPPPPPAVANNIVVSGSRVAAPGAYAHENRERYAGETVAAVQRAAETPVSTFSVDVDTGSYANARRFLLDGEMPPSAAVRTEEFLNYFRYDYPLPRDAARPFSVTTDAARTPWNAETRLIRIGLKGYDVAREQRPAANLVFLVDVSGSMNSRDKLPLVKAALTNLAARLNPHDRVSIVVYAGAAGLVLQPTHDKAAVMAALDCLEAGGSTAGGDGIKLAYSAARQAYIEDGINRVILCTDGDFNVGITDDEALETLVKRERESGITLTTLGFGTGNYNEAMMEKIADVGNGNYGYVDSAMEADKLLNQELSSTLFTIAKDVKVQVEFNPAVISEYRLIGYENRALREEDFANDRVDAGDIGAGHQVTALYEVVPAGAKGWLPDRRYAADTRASGSRDEAAWLKLRYKLPNQAKSRLIEQPIPAAALRTASAPAGDFAFQAAVAAFGQRLRGDAQLNGFDYADIRALAGSDGNYWRKELARLVELAAANTHQAAGAQ